MACYGICEKAAGLIKAAVKVYRGGLGTYIRGPAGIGPFRCHLSLLATEVERVQVLDIPPRVTSNAYIASSKIWRTDTGEDEMPQSRCTLPVC